MSRLGFSALMLIVLAACASKPTYEFDYDHNFDFSSFKTYHWYDDMVHTRESEYRKFNPSDKRIREVVAGNWPAITCARAAAQRPISGLTTAFQTPSADCAHHRL